jgi:hypothetical protein
VRYFSDNVVLVLLSGRESHHVASNYIDGPSPSTNIRLIRRPTSTMPRQLPWAKKGAAKVKSEKPYPGSASRISNIDDAFFEDTVPASNSKGKATASESDDDLPNLPAEPSTPRTKSRTKEACRKRREDSSSPPPPAGDLEQPRVEGMHRAISKFDLRDDEWMMVEDEFLETAKLFTRHLHIAEYEKLKEMIEEKKKSADIARPVVANAKMSETGTMKDKAMVQEQKQKRAIRDVFASQDKDEMEEQRATSSTHMAQNTATPSYSASKRVIRGTPKLLTKAHAASDSESEDLDALRPPEKPPLKTTTSTPAKISSVASGSKGDSPLTPTTKTSRPTFAKPAPPVVATKPRSRISRAKPFDMLDDWVPNKSQRSLKASPEQPAKPAVTPCSPIAGRLSRSFDTADTAKPRVHARSASSSVGAEVLQQGPDGNGRSKDVADRLAKRKADREKNEIKKKRKTLNADDIPTFLF